MANSSDPYRGLRLSSSEKNTIIQRLAKERGIKEKSAARYVQKLTSENVKSKVGGKGKGAKQFARALSSVRASKRIPPISRGGELLESKRIKVSVRVQGQDKEYTIKPEGYIFFYFDQLPEGYKAIVWESPENTQSVYDTRGEAIDIANSFLGGTKWENVQKSTGNRGMIHLITVNYVPAGVQRVYNKITGTRKERLVKDFRQEGYHLRVLVGVPDREGKGRGGGGGGGGGAEAGYVEDDDPPLDEDDYNELLDMEREYLETEEDEREFEE